MRSVHTPRLFSMLALLTLSAALTSLVVGCAASGEAERPEGTTTFRKDRLEYFSANVDYDFYVPARTAADTLGPHPVARARYFWAEDPTFRNAQVVGGLPALRVAIAREMQGFTCPVQGRVVVEAMIDAQGQAVLPIVAGSLHPECDARVLRAFTSMTFEAGRLKGRAIAMPLTLPVTVR